MKHIIQSLILALHAATVVLLLQSCTQTTPGAAIESVKIPDKVHVPDSQFCATIARTDRPAQAVGVRGQFWKNGQTINIKFIGGTAAQRQYVKDAFTIWSNHINLDFKFVTSGKTDCRISFISGDGSWSYIGIDNAQIPYGQATMNIGWPGLDVCLHEIGHFLGMAHEQANPNGGITWNKPVVYAALAAPPNNWSKEMVDANVFFKYDTSKVYTTPFDGISIMEYSIPDSWVIGGKGYPGGKVLSPTDIAFMSGIYPKTIQPPAPGGVTITAEQANKIVAFTSKSILYADSARITLKKATGL